MSTSIQVERQTLNIESVAKILGISHPTAYELARRDQLPVPLIRLGNRMVVSKHALEAVLSATKVDDVEQRKDRLIPYPGDSLEE